MTSSPSGRAPRCLGWRPCRPGSSIARQTTRPRTSRPPEGGRHSLACDSNTPGPDEFVFSAPEGGPLRRTNFRRRTWLPTVRASVGEPLRFHDLRHTHAAMLIAQGERLKVIQLRLGHSSIQVTLDTSGHLFEGLDQAAADCLDATFLRTPSDFHGPRAIPASPNSPAKRRKPSACKVFRRSGWPDLNRRPLDPQSSGDPHRGPGRNQWTWRNA